MKTERYISTSAMALSVIATVLGIAAICNACPRVLGMDYLGWIVGVLALLSAILLGWQLFSLFRINNLKDEMEDMRNQAALKVEECLVEMHATMALHVSSFPNYLNDSELIYKYTINCLSMTIHLGKIGDFGRCEKQINSLLKKLSQTEKVKLPQQYRTMLAPLIVEAQTFPCVSNRGRLWEIFEFFQPSDDKDIQQG